MNLFKKIENYESDFTTFPRTFEGYRWYKPIIIAILGVILYFIFLLLMLFVVPAMGGLNIESIAVSFSSDAISMDNWAGILGSLMVVMIIPSIYIPSRLLRERPFSSYLSIGGWNWGIFFKSAAIALVVYLLINLIQVLVDGTTVDIHFTAVTLILCIVITPFQCFAEEYLCRGFVMQALGSWFKVPIIAIVLQALLFMILHEYNAYGLISVLVTGLAFGFIAWYTKGLEITTALHSINNIVTFLIFGFGLANPTTQITPADLIVSFAVLFVSIGLIFLIDRKYGWIGLKRDAS